MGKKKANLRKSEEWKINPDSTGDWGKILLNDIGRRGASQAMSFFLPI